MRAYLEMDLRLERAGKSLATFLEDDVSGTYLGLGNDAQAHLERFRSFLHSFYVGKYGYWPPEPTTKNGTALPKSVCLSMYFDFRRLYEYLVDPASTCSIQNNRPAKGGICVLQNVAAFDTRNKYQSLPHPLPLIPEIPDDMLRQRSGSLMKMFGNRQARAERRATVLAALSAATNPSNTAVTECALMREYLLFEKSWTMKESETISCADARKVRWILIYTILQTLISVTRAPIEVRDIEGVSYPLCCQVVGTPPWKTNTSAGNDVQVPAKAPGRIIEIKPDVQYNTPRSSRTSFSSITLSAFPMIRRGSTGQDSVIRTPTSRASTSCEIFGPGYSETMKGFYGDLGPSSPGSSAADASSGVAWSCSSSEDGMEHVSVGESVSSYGDGEEKRNSNSSNAESGTGWSIASFQSEISSSAEVEHYIWA